MAWHSVSQTKILWTGGWFAGTGSAVLAEPVSAQKNGIVLVWCAYDSKPLDHNWIYTYVPRWHTTDKASGSNGVVCSGIVATSVMSKYVYVNNTEIKSHQKNEQTVSVGGITAENQKWCLRVVLGI